MREIGFCVKFQREHPGQGTRNELLLFERNYLEWLCLADREEAEQNMVRLDRRIDWRETGASPFGIALRGPRAQLGELAWTKYAVPGFVLDLWIWSDSLDDPRLPLLIVFEQSAELAAAGGPHQQGYPPALFEHASGAGGIADCEIEGPGYGAAAAMNWPAGLRVRDGVSPRMRLSLEGSSVRGRVGALLELV